MKTLKRRQGVSTGIFAATAAVLLIIAGIGFGLYVTQAPRTITTTITSTATSTGTTTLVSTQTTTVTATPTTKARIGVVGGFLNGKVVAFEFYTPFECKPAVSELFPDQVEAQDAAKVTPCEVGVPGTFPPNAIPVWGLVPAFAGLSIFGVPTFGATPEGFATYNGKTLITHCTGNGHQPPCPDHPPLHYSPANSMVLQSMGITSGVMGLPQGVMPFPAHSHIVDTLAGEQDIPWNAIAVLVFDPNIFPNPATGRCEQTVPSSLTEPIANCLTSIAALQAAMVTTNSEIDDANADNPIWQALGKPLTQVVVPGASDPTQYRNANSNINVPFAVKDYNPYPPYSP